MFEALHKPSGRHSKSMTNSLDSVRSPEVQPAMRSPSGWLKVGVIAGASALAGGLAAAWWYRKTLQKLQQAELRHTNPDFRIPGDEAEDEG